MMLRIVLLLCLSSLAWGLAAGRVPYSLNVEWHLLRKSVGNISFTEIPRNTEKILLFNDSYDLGNAPAKSAAVFYNEFESERDGVMQIGMAADWWFECRLNGETVYSTLAGGNMEQQFSPENHVFNLPVKKGRNLLAVRVLAGAAGWKFFCGEVPYRKIHHGVYEVTRGPEWRPVNMDRIDWAAQRRKFRNPVDWRVRLDMVKIKPGTALDLSVQFPRFHIDRQGRVIVNQAGKLAFETEPEKAIRFRGSNLMITGWESNFYEMTREELEELAETIRIRGMNLVRFHYLDQALCGRYADPHAWEKRSFDADKLPYNVETLPADKEMLQRYDWFIKCLRDRGIYILLDVANSKMGWSNFYPDPPADKWSIYQLYFDNRYRKNWSAGAEFLLSRVNPYTGTRLKDDPQCIGITLFNEQDIRPHHVAILSPYWRKAYPQYRSDLTLQLLAGTGKESEDARKFLLDMMADMNRFYLGELKRIGFRGLVTNYDMSLRLMEIPARSEMSAVAMHIYCGAPFGVAQPLSMPYRQKVAAYPWVRGKEFRLSRQSSIKSNGGWLGQAAMTRMPGKPFLLTEYSYLPYARFSHEGGLGIGGIAALQGWDMLVEHTNTAMLYYAPSAPGSFSSHFHPMVRANEVIAALAWQRGDVAEAEHEIAIAVSPAMVNSPEILCAPGSGYNAFAMLTKIGTCYPGTSRQADLTITPQYFTPTVSTEYFASLAAMSPSSGRHALASAWRQMQQKKILPAGNRTDPVRGIFQSETGELTFDTQNQTMAIVTPRLEGAVVKKNIPFPLGALTIRSSSTPAAFCAASLDAAPLRESRRILLIHATSSAAEGTVFNNEFFDAAIDYGTFPMLIRSAKFSLELKCPAAPKIYALNFNGTREKELSGEWKDGTLFFQLDTSSLEYGTFFYEIVRP